MRYLILLLILVGCSAEAKLESACEKEIKATLLAPSTYSLVRAIHSSDGNHHQVAIEYESRNGFNVPVRGVGRCEIAGDDLSEVSVMLNMTLNGRTHQQRLLDQVRALSR